MGTVTAPPVLPRVRSYSPKSPRHNCMRVRIGKATLYFSYETLVAFRTPGDGLVLSANEWGRTTGKHLTWVRRDNPGIETTQLPRAEFESAWQRVNRYPL